MLLLVFAACVFISREEHAARRCLVDDADGDGVCDGDDCAPEDPLRSPTLAEACNGRDDDCDGEVDEGLYPDYDADGYGADIATGPCFAHWVTTPGDCDDGEPATFPGAVERCDGVRNDCSTEWALASEAGRVTHESDTGFRDLTDVFTGAPEEPAWVELPADGTLRICEHDPNGAVTQFYARLRTNPRGGTLTIEGATRFASEATGVEGAGRPRISAGQVGTVLVVEEGAPVDLTLRNLLLSGGARSAAEGGGVYVHEGQRLTMEACVVTGNTGAFGGIFASGELFLRDSQIYGNGTTDQEDQLFGGGVTVAAGGAADIDGCVISDNYTGRLGGGLRIASDRVTVRNSVIARNEGAEGGGGLYVEALGYVHVSASTIEGNATEPYSLYYGGGLLVDGVAACSEATSITGNRAGDRGGGVSVGTGAFTSDGCVISGNVVVGDAPSDLFAAGVTYVHDGAVCGSCTPDAGCVETTCP